MPANSAHDVNGDLTITGNLFVGGHTYATADNLAAPSAAAGSNAGGSPPAPVVVAGALDSRGEITFGTGTVPAAGNQVVVTFNKVLPKVPHVSVEPYNSVTAALNLHVVSRSTTGFTIASQAAPAASQANTVYDCFYRIEL